MTAVDRESLLDDRDREWVAEQVEQAPPLRQEQIDSIARVLDGIPSPTDSRPGGSAPVAARPGTRSTA